MGVLRPLLRRSQTGVAPQVFNATRSNCIKTRIMWVVRLCEDGPSDVSDCALGVVR